MTLLSELTRALASQLAQSWRAEDAAMERAEIMAAATVLDIASGICAEKGLPVPPPSEADFERLLESAFFDLTIVERASARKRAAK